jgi:hypothetical protein
MARTSGTSVKGDFRSALPGAGIGHAVPGGPSAGGGGRGFLPCQGWKTRSRLGDVTQAAAPELQRLIVSKPKQKGEHDAQG